MIITDYDIPAIYDAIYILAGVIGFVAGCVVTYVVLRSRD